MEIEEYLRKHFSKTSIKSYINTINLFLVYMGERSENAVYADIMEYIGHLRNRNLNAKSVRNHLHGIKLYYNYLLETGKREDHPCKYIYLKDRIDRQIHTENLYTKEEMNQFYESFENHTKEKIIAGLLIYQALTVQEITELKISDIDLENGNLHIKGGKQNNGRRLSLKSNQILSLHQYIENHPDKESYLILNNNGEQQSGIDIKRKINKGKVKKLSPLKIRQSVIMHLLKENHDVRVVQTFAGHKRTSSTEAYKQSGLEELKTVIGKLHPLQ